MQRKLILLPQQVRQETLLLPPTWQVGAQILSWDRVKEAGGLAIIERKDMNRGGLTDNCADVPVVRAIRSSQFYVSLEDDLMRLFGSDRDCGNHGPFRFERWRVDSALNGFRTIERAQKKWKKITLEYVNVFWNTTM